MAFNEELNNKVREALMNIPNVEEKHMFGGVCYMVDGKMCVGIVKDEMMCRIDPLIYDDVLEREGCREMVFTGKPMKGYVFVDEFGMRTESDFQFWIQSCLEFNKIAKASPRKNKNSKK